MEVIGLLQSKKRCLRRFLEASEDFLSEAVQGDLSDLTHFEARREKMIKTLVMIDRHMTEAVLALPLEARTPALSKQVQGSLQEEAILIQTISKIDNRIVVCIEEEKRKLLKTLAADRKSHEMVGRFRSSWIAEAGEGLDEKA